MLPPLKQTEMAENLFLYHYRKKIFAVKPLQCKTGIPSPFAIKYNLLAINQFLKLTIKHIFLNSLKIILTNAVCIQEKMVNFNLKKY